ncbi:MAG: DUF6048 family protein [Bacteroidales bacterium]|nr:DUF6048 family protein [Bacteroidales bacterium]MCM1146719.1 DUF6048 family protein [Bacteroidales bacterium]MCM1205536.1 DUF6048 family protein [Bacillota bacterium]MCM1509202.1 DUF6048 family protein [Clostridium sp.]
MKRTVLILLAALSTLTISAQENEEPTEKKTPFLESISVGIDLAGPIRRAMSGRGEYQAFVQAHIKGLFLPTVEVGYGTADRYDADTFTSYKTKAPFGRIGCDFNILKNRHDDYRLTAGIRYGITSFSYDTTTPDDEEQTSFTTVTEKCTLQWAELTFGADAKVWGPLHMGWSLRYRRKLSRTGYTALPVYAPGYGRGTESSRWMALYNISLQF